mgnify:CR=1 FL=1
MVIEKEEEMTRVVEEVCVGGTLQELEDFLDTMKRAPGLFW